MKTINIILSFITRGCFFLFYILFFSLIFSCGNKLELAPTDAFSKEQFWTSESNALIALTGMYRGPNAYGANLAVPRDWFSYSGIIFLELATDNCYDRRGDNSEFNRLTNGTLLPNNGVVKSYWDGAYNRIALCNDFLENISGMEMDANVKKRMESEARFLRATQYFYLSQFWGDVPLVTTLLSPDEANNVTKEPKSKIIEFIVSELKDAADGLPRTKDIPSSEIGRASKQAALAYLGRIYLSEKRYNDGAGVYKQIVDFGDNIIDPDYQGLFTPKNENSTENIFSIQFVGGETGNFLPQHAYPAVAGGYHFVNPLESLSVSYGFDDGSPFSYDDERFNYQDMGANRDPRFRYNFLWDGSSFGSYIYDCHPDASSSVDQLTYSKQATRSGYGLRKYFDESFNGSLQNDYGGNVPVIRYAEVLLGYLECELEAGNEITQRLLDLTINAVRGRESVGLPPILELNTNLLRPILRKERRIELAFEGIRLWDILRWEIGDDVLSGDFWGAPFPDSKLYATTSKKIDPDYSRWFVTSKNFRNGIDNRWPIPESEVNINPKLGQ